ncbi:GIY-YIG nuclease family protein [Tenacibaculum sp. 1B UA]|uniref:GIY-YIG nuclease family protein n=1 Tax=unclassified Tenacibaculum TaxID=2635139 RepID=UPI0026E212FD|nr:MULTISPECIES: GIY-YIG nuclease family protein [unclassified Tenacibaculum]MDO6675144.1 GIY-YIG nuclease family protein [Tenacibaculum sp. 1_MG-2023]MDX8552697.1 GIY-YIG nuclease family protein [Tenacibaculum sp. 1B UA]
MHKTNHQYYIYIITNKKDGVLYIGVTNNLERRIFEHKNKLVKGFSSKYNLDKLIYFEEHQFIKEAIKREKNMKKWKRAWKINLVIKENPNWDDLAKNWYN